MAKTDRPGGKPDKKNKKSNLRWVITIFFLTIIISGTISFTSSSLMASSGMLVAFLILLFIVLLGILFDIIGVAVTSAEEKPFHSMAAKKVPGAAECIMLLRHADRVASICNDVIGDICRGNPDCLSVVCRELGELGHVCSGSRSHRRREGSGKVYGDAFVYIHCVFSR